MLFLVLATLSSSVLALVLKRLNSGNTYGVYFFNYITCALLSFLTLEDKALWRGDPLPLWLGALSLTMAAMFNIAHTVPMLAVVLVCLNGLGPVFRGLIGLGLDWLSALAEALYRLTLTAPMDLSAVSLWDPAYLLWCWGVGLLWSAGSTAVGLALFARRDIH